jgi:hypothetical protein
MSVPLKTDAFPVAVADQGATTATLADLLSHSIRLRDLYKGALRQLLSGHPRFPGVRQVLEAHCQEQLLLIDQIVGRIAELGGAVTVFASGFLHGEHCRLLRGPHAIDKLLKDFVEAHDAVFSPPGTDHSEDERPLSRDGTVAEVRRVNQRQCELINAMLSRRSIGS